MFVFASSVTKPEVYRQCAEPGIRLVAEPDAVVLSRPATGSIFESYNALIDEAEGLDDVEALVLLHQDTELTDPTFCERVRAELSEHEHLGVLGCVGAVGVRSIAWWEGSVTWASFSHRYPEYGGGEFPSLGYDPERELPGYARTGQVDAVDGFLLVLPPWSIRNLRFDASLGGLLHGYDFDLCMQAREAGRTIRTADLKAVHHHSVELASDLDHWADAHVAVAEKWSGRIPRVGEEPGDWRTRAMRAEAEAAASRAVALSVTMRTEARRTRHQVDLHAMRSGRSWRLTRPLRALEAAMRFSRRLGVAR